MPIRNVQEQFSHEIADLYDAEHQFLKAQQELAPQASDMTLQGQLTQHIGQTEEHIRRLEQVFGALGQEPKRETCAGAHGIVTEGRKTVKEADNPAIRDALIGGAALRVEHDEIAGYRSALVAARQVSQAAVVTLLEQLLHAEEAAARKLEHGAPGLLKKAG